MNSKSTYSSRSLYLSLTALILLMLTYAFLPDVPDTGAKILIGIIFISIIGFFLLGIVFSIFSIKNKESGIKKYFGILIPLLTVLFLILIPVLMGIGFILNDPK